MVEYDKPKFTIGDRVMVRDLEAENGLKGHMRAPLYCRKKSGVVKRNCGNFGNPETLAYAGDGAPKQPLYRVKFKQQDLWPTYTGSSIDSIDIEIYQHWLIPHAS